MTTVPPQRKVQGIRERILGMIRRGELAPGQRLPSERDLAETFQVSRPTLNKAMASLEDDRLLDRARGRGTFVRPDVARGTVVMVLPSEMLTARTTTPFWDSMMRRLMEVMSERGLRGQFLLSAGQTQEQIAESLHLSSSFWDHVTVVVAVTRLDQMSEAFADRGATVVNFVSAL